MCGRRELALLAVRLPVGIVVVAVGPEVDVDRIGLGGDRGQGRAREGNAQDPEAGYSSQPH